MRLQRTSNNLILWPVLILLMVASSGCSSEEPGVEIPLNTIWGYLMPGTLDIETLEPDHFGPAVRQLPEQERIDLLMSSLCQQISQSIHRQSEMKQPIGTGFAVAGTGREALAAVKEALGKNQIPPQTFPADTEVSLFFFTRDSGRYVHLKDVRQGKGFATIRYRFVPHSISIKITANMTRHFVLIPVGKIPAGQYEVDIVQSPMEKKYRKHHQAVSEEWVEKIICKSFWFAIGPTGGKAVINQ